jgi:hypothetical protein
MRVTQRAVVASGLLLFAPLTYGQSPPGSAAPATTPAVTSPQPSQVDPAPPTPWVPQPFVPEPVVGKGSESDWFGGQGQLIVSADRLFGISQWTYSSEFNNSDTFSTSGTAVNLLFGDGGGRVGALDADSTIRIPYLIPRLGLDYVVSKGITLGGAVGYLSRSGTSNAKYMGITTSTDTPSDSAFVLAPRAGYAVALSAAVAIWIRAGITYYAVSAKETTPSPTSPGQFDSNQESDTGVAFNVEPELVLTPVRHFGLTIGLVGDIPLSGTGTFQRAGSNNPSYTERISNFGITFGVLGHI